MFVAALHLIEKNNYPSQFPYLPRDRGRCHPFMGCLLDLLSSVFFFYFTIHIIGVTEGIIFRIAELLLKCFQFIIVLLM